MLRSAQKTPAPSPACVSYLPFSGRLALGESGPSLPFEPAFPDMMVLFRQILTGVWVAHPHFLVLPVTPSPEAPFKPSHKCL